MRQVSERVMGELQALGLKNVGRLIYNASTPEIYEESITRSEARIVHLGALAVRTGQYTGRSPNDKFVVEEPGSKDKIAWGKVNRPISQEKFEALHRRMMAYLQGKDLFIQDCFAGADEAYRLPIRIITQFAWHSLFARNMFIQATPQQLADHRPAFTVIDAPHFKADAAFDGTRSDVFIIINFARRIVLIGGTEYAGEIKKSIFTVMNYLLPQQGVLSMHCSANYGQSGDTAVFFGLSGTGKTTLSADPARTLIGDDEHGWSDSGVFNFEGGCYAKIIKLSPTSEPEIYETTRRFGTVLENVSYDMETRHLDLDDASLTENTRSAYPITHIPNATLTGKGGIPKNIIMLTADAFGVLPPIARLTPAQAMYHFLSGYTAKVAGTEKGVTEPQATFSTCFGAPFMALAPAVYAHLLGDRIQKSGANVWLINTGWSGGPYGVGQRMKIAYTRAMVHAALDGTLDNVQFTTDPVFGLSVPMTCPNVPEQVLNPRSTWPDAASYDRQAEKLADMFNANFKQFEMDVSPEVRAAGPKHHALSGVPTA
jgi:phosphoenolpyruvate carboxykinase (ATP)